MSLIVQKGDPVLKKKAADVSRKLFGTLELRKTIAAMKEALESQEDGVALAAPQIGISLRIFIVAPRAFENGRGRKTPHPPDTHTATKDEHDLCMVYINPVITKLSRKKRLVDEGCLSIRNYYGKVSRSEKATVEAYDEQGKKFTRGGADLVAQIFQHEIDHLNGILFVEKADDLYYLPPQKIQGSASSQQ